MTTLQHIALSNLHESPLNPRQRFDDKTLRELAANIGQVGVLTPLLVRPNAKGYEIAAGHRRFRAAKLAKLAEVPCVVRDLDDKTFLEIMTIENLQREDVHPIDEALGYQVLIDKTGMEIAAIAAKVGKSESYVYQRLKLAALVKPAQKAFIEEKITAGHAILIARLQPKDQEEALKFSTRGFNSSVRNLADWIDDNIHMDLHAAPFKKDDAQLVAKAGPCTTCPKRTGFAPALFPDIAKKDTCTDRACFQAKRAAFVAGRKAELAEQGEKPVELSEEYYRAAKGALAKDHWIEVGNRFNKVCEHTRAGIIVEGDDLGRVLKVCTEPRKCRTHRGAQEREGRQTALTGRNFAQERKHQAKQQARDQAIGVIVEKTKALATDDLRLLAKACMHNLWHDHLKGLVKRRGWEAEKAKHGGWNYAELAEKKIDGMSAAEVAGLLMEYTMLGRGSDEMLPKVAKQHGVNLAKLEQTALAALTAKAREKAAKQKAAAKASAKAKVQTSAKPKTKLKKAA